MGKSEMKKITSKGYYDRLVQDIKKMKEKEITN